MCVCSVLSCSTVNVEAAGLVQLFCVSTVRHAADPCVLCVIFVRLCVRVFICIAFSFFNS